MSILLLSIFWVIRTIKTALFYAYLWQLKNYHVGRFLDHFRTEKGKRIIFNYLNLVKILLVFSFLLFPKSLALILIILYFLESGLLFKNILSKRILGPVYTKKAILLLFINIVAIFLIPILAYWQFKLLPWIAISLLVADILSPIWISLIILFLQPFTVLARNQIIKKATQKIEKQENLLTIGITGSYGKTTTKEFLYTILSEKFNVLKTREHQNSEIGISQCILSDLKPTHEIFICEMGAYNKGGIKLLCNIAKPKIGILTGINEQHMATFGSQENIIKAKYELIESLPEKGLAIFNGDNTYCLELYHKTKKSKRVYKKQNEAKKDEVDIYTKNIEISKDECMKFKVCAKEECEDFKVHVFGPENIQNLLGAICCAKELGMSLEEISKSCKKITPNQGPMQIRKGINGLNILDSTYSANPDGVIAQLEYLRELPGKKVIIMPCLIELGQSSKEIHKIIGEKIGEICDLAIITTKDKYKEIRESAIGTGMTEIDIFCLEDSKEIFDKIKAFCKTGDNILLESRVPQKLIEMLIK